MFISFQSQTRCQAPGDLFVDPGTPADLWTFQSQTRCQAPRDATHINASDVLARYFNFKREPTPPTPPTLHQNTVSLSLYFNLRRDARPLASMFTPRYTCFFYQFQSQTRCQAPGDLSPNFLCLYSC